MAVLHVNKGTYPKQQVTYKKCEMQPETGQQSVIPQEQEHKVLILLSLWMDPPIHGVSMCQQFTGLVEKHTPPSPLKLALTEQVVHLAGDH